MNFDLVPQDIPPGAKNGHISASRSKFENRLDGPKLCHHMTLHAKNQTSNVISLVLRYVRLDEASSWIFYSEDFCQSLKKDHFPRHDQDTI